MHHLKAPTRTTEYPTYLKQIQNKLKFEKRGVSDKYWEYPKDEKEYLRKKSTLNLGQFHRAYCDDFGFGYQKMFKLIKAHKKYLIEKNLIIIKQNKKQINKETNKGNTLEIILINKSKYEMIVNFLTNFQV
jgi:hypothetical protein